MTRAQEQAIRRWYQWVMFTNPPAWRSYPSPDVMGLSFDARSVFNGSRTELLAEMSSKDPQGRQMVRLALPNQLSWGRHKMIRKVLEQEGAVCFSVPSGTRAAADIVPGTLELIAHHSTQEPFRAREELYRGVVRADTRLPARDRWGINLGYSRWERSERTAYFLSGFDRNERRLSYFFCELPPGAEPTTVAEAYEALKPESVKIAEEQKLKVIRQGDMFFIRQKKFKPDSDNTPTGADFLLGTNHMAQQTLREGRLLYVRGYIKHKPRGRRPDHAPIRLGRHWWICVKNTVPVVA